MEFLRNVAKFLRDVALEPIVGPIALCCLLVLASSHSNAIVFNNASHEDAADMPVLVTNMAPPHRQFGYSVCYHSDGLNCSSRLKKHRGTFQQWIERTANVRNPEIYAIQRVESRSRGITVMIYFTYGDR